MAFFSDIHPEKVYTFLLNGFVFNCMNHFFIRTETRTARCINLYVHGYRFSWASNFASHVGVIFIQTTSSKT